MKVLCPVKVTSPAPSPGALALGFAANMVCGAECQIVAPGEIMSVRCPRGHVFFARADQIIDS